MKLRSRSSTRRRPWSSSRRRRSHRCLSTGTRTRTGTPPPPTPEGRSVIKQGLSTEQAFMIVALLFILALLLTLVTE